MSIITSQTAAERAPMPSPRVAEHAADLLRRLFRGLDGTMLLRLWDGTLLKLGAAGSAASTVPSPGFTLICRSPAAVGTMALGRDPLRLAEAYFRDDVDIEGDIFAALGLKDHLQAIRIPWRDQFGAVLGATRLRLADRSTRAASGPRASLQGRAVKAHSKTENQEAIAFHYDVSNEFYALWLGEAMVYSCAYFERPDDDLDRAQQAKLDHVCRKLLLQPGERLLDIGCGWGALAIHAATHYGVQAHGITLSRRQMELARERVAQAGLQNRVTIELRDYRDLSDGAVYDKVSSVGMFEHIGLKNLPAYFLKVQQLLAPGGLFLNHGITHDVEGWKKTLSSEFINRYVFPDGQLDTVGNIQRAMERQRLEILDVESLRPHYALTLRHWVNRLEEQHVRSLDFVSESTWRVWRLYMAACALEFEAGEIGVYQVLASKRGACVTALPLTRRHLYMCQHLSAAAPAAAQTEPASAPDQAPQRAFEPIQR